MIQSFADSEAERIFRGQRSRELPFEIQNTARRKLRQLSRALRLDDMRVPGGNRFEKLKGFTPSRYSVRINDQWRLTFSWSGGDAHNVRIEDYHKG